MGKVTAARRTVERVGVWNTFVEGDNLEVLRSDGRSRGVDLVYIDPPYNTGNSFAYRDDYSAVTGSDWVTMMRPRLEAAREVLAETGAIFVSIDDNEQARLRLLMDEVFGPAQFLAQIVVNLNAKGRQLGKGFATSHEYLLAYARDVRRCVLDASSPDTVDLADFPLETPDGRRYRHLPLRNTNKKFNPVTARTLHFPVYGDPVSGRVSAAPFDDAVEISPVFGDGRPAVWRWSAPLIEQRPDDLVCRVIKGRGDRADVFQKDWWHEERARSCGPSGSPKRSAPPTRPSPSSRRSSATSSSCRSRPGWCVGCCRRCRPMRSSSTSSPAPARPVMRWSSKIRRRRDASVHQRELGRGGPSRLERRPGGLRHRRRHHPRPSAGRG